MTIPNLDPTARHYHAVHRRLTPLARGVYSLMRKTGTLTALDAQRSPLGINSSSLTRRITELRDAGFDVKSERLRDDVTGRPYTKYWFGPKPTSKA